MDDCCNLAEALKFTPSRLNIGFLEIVSEIELNVTAVYTASGLEASGVSIEVESISARKV